MKGGVKSRFPSRPNPLDLAIAAAAFAVAMGVSSALGGSLPAALGLGLLLAVGTYLWLPDASRRRGDLGQGVIVSVLVALAFLAIQRDTEERLRDLDHARNLAQENQGLRLTLGLERDLSRIDLRDRDLRRFVLVDKLLVRATLDNARLDRAVLSGADLRRVSAIGTSFKHAALDGADLRGALLSRRVVSPVNKDTPAQSFPDTVADQASFYYAILDGADLREVDLEKGHLEGASLRRTRLMKTNLTGADLERATLHAADLTGAILSGAKLNGADLRHARICTDLDDVELEGAHFSPITRWPAGFDPRAAGARPRDVSPKSVRGEPVPDPHYKPC